MSVSCIVGLSLASFGVGVGFGMTVPFLAAQLYGKMCSAFDINLCEDN